jgi:hypothetical protein
MKWEGYWLSGHLETLFQLNKLLAPYDIKELLIDLGKFKNIILITDIMRKKHDKSITNGKNIKIYKQTFAAYLKALSQNSPGWMRKTTKSQSQDIL